MLKKILFILLSLSVGSSFAAPIPPSNISLGAGVVKKGNVYIVTVPVKDHIPNQTIGLQFCPDRNKIAGKKLRFSAEMKYSGIASDASGTHVGAKLLVSYKDNAGRKFFSIPSLSGSDSEWKKYTMDVQVPADPTSFSDFTLHIGIQQAWGILYIRNPEMEISNIQPMSFSLPEDIGPVAIPIGNIAGDFVRHDGDTLVVEIPKKKNITNETRGGELVLDMDSMKNKLVCIRGEFRYQDIGSDTSGAHVGAKLLCDFSAPYSGRKFAFSPSFTGSCSEWKEIAVYCPLTEFTSSARIILGIQQGWGKVEFRNLTAEVISPTDSGPSDYSVPKGFKCEYSQWLLDAPRRRGFMSPPPGLITERDIRDLGKMNVNLIRYQMVDGIKNLADRTEYAVWLERHLAKLDSLMPVLKETGIKVVIDMHWPPGGRYGYGGSFPASLKMEATKRLSPVRVHRVMVEEEFFKFYILLWKKIAERYKGNSVIYGYDLINEPDVGGPTPYHWADLQYAAARAIREIDPEMPIIVESNFLADPAVFNLPPMPLKNIIYQIHMYNPMNYSHQGVQHKAYMDHYPKYCVPYKWNAEFLRASMKPVIAFQKKYGAKIYVGEFSVTRWAPGAGQYLKDLIPLFEEFGWDWTFHAFREWDGWSPEHVGTPDKPQINRSNDRMLTLQSFFDLNGR